VRMRRGRTASTSMCRKKLLAWPQAASRVCRLTVHDCICVTLWMYMQWVWCCCAQDRVSSKRTLHDKPSEHVVCKMKMAKCMHAGNTTRCCHAYA
jgi:hypothetical protein